MVWRALDTVIDPELGLPVTDLGLVYNVEISDRHVTVSMTTTTPVCPLGEYLVGITRARIAELTNVETVEVSITHEPVDYQTIEPKCPSSSRSVRMMHDSIRRMVDGPLDAPLLGRADPPSRLGSASCLR